MSGEKRRAPPGTDTPPAPSASAADQLVGAASRELQRRLYTPVLPKDHAVPAAPPINGADPNESLTRAREAEIAAEDHRLQLAILQNAREQVEQQAAEQKVVSWVSRVLLWGSAVIGVAGSLNLIARWVWEFFHPLSHFDLMLSATTCVVSQVCSCVGVYVASRFGRSKSGSSASKLPDATGAPLTLGDADVLTRLSDGP